MLNPGNPGNQEAKTRFFSFSIIDFLSAHWREHCQIAFNVADSAICVGVFLLAIDMYFEEKRQKRLKG